VADRDRRHPDHPDPGRDAAEAGFGDTAVFRGRAGHRRCEGKRLDGVRRAISACARLAGIMRTVFATHKRFVETYFSAYPGLYFTGDGARRDGDGFYWITGRVDDVIMSPVIARHREIESALVAHPKDAERRSSATRTTSGQGIYAM